MEDCDVGGYSAEGGEWVCAVWGFSIGSSATGYLGRLGDLRGAGGLVAVLDFVPADEDEHSGGLLDRSTKIRIACPFAGQCLDTKLVDDVVG